MQVHSDRYATQIMNAEKLEDHHEGWRTLWFAIAGVMAITLTWNVLMLSMNGISY
jgi:LPS sulfotransferase NodH